MGWGNKILVGVVVKTKLGELEEEVREVFLRRSRKELTGVVQEVSEKKRLLVMFQYGCENYLVSNQLTVVTVDNIYMTKEAKVPIINEEPYDTVPL